MADIRGIRAGRAFVELGVDDKLTRGLRAAERRLKAFGEGLQAVGARMFAAGAAVLTPLAAAVKTFADSGDQLAEMSQRTGVSVEALSELGFAAEQSGADLETLETGLRKMQRFLVAAARGSDGAAEALGLLRLSMTDLANLSPEQQFKLIGDRLAQIADPTLRAALAMELFGKSGTRLLPLLQDGARGIEALQEEARGLGLTLSTDAAQQAVLLNDTLNILWRVVKRLTATIGEALADVVIDLSGRITRVVVAVTAWVRQNQALIVSAAKVAVGVLAVGAAFVAAGTLIMGLGTVFGRLASAVSGIGTIFSMLGTVLGALISPIGLVVAAVAGLGAAILVYTGAGADALAWLGETFRRLKDGVLKVVGGIADALAAGDIALAAEILWLSLKFAWQQGVDTLNRVWVAAKRFFVQTAYDMWYGALYAAEVVWHGLMVGWTETTAFMSKTWINFTNDLKAVWAVAQNWWKKAWAQLRHLFDETFDLEAAKRKADEEFAEVARSIEDQRTAKLAETEQKRRERREKARQEYKTAVAEISRQWAAAEQETNEQAMAEAARTQEALGKAREELQNAIAKAREKREEAEVAAPSRRRVIDPLAGLEDQFAGLGDLLARKITVIGTFNPAAVMGLGAADAEERTARNTEQIARHTKRLVETATTGRLSFT